MQEDRTNDIAQDLTALKHQVNQIDGRLCSVSHDVNQNNGYMLEQMDRLSKDVENINKVMLRYQGFLGGLMFVATGVWLFFSDVLKHWITGLFK